MFTTQQHKKSENPIQTRQYSVMLLKHAGVEWINSRF